MIMKLYVLGTAGPWPEKNRFGSSFVLQTAGNYLMFDCGPGTTYKLAQTGLNPVTVDWLFFTHHHYDHNVDYPCFLLSRWDQGNRDQKPLRVYGPQPTRLITERLIGENGAFVFDWKARVEHPASQANYQRRGGRLPRVPPSVDAVDLEDGSVVEGAGWSVTARRVHHVEPWLESLAYRLDTGEGSIAFIGDAGPSDSIPDLIRGVDALVIGCGQHRGMDIPAALATASTGTADAAAYAREAAVKTLVLTHMQNNLAGPGSRERVIAEVAEGYGGTIVFADELMVLDLPVAAR
jgi:ribonuclease BN (tRNA processing enzyme)